MHRGWDRFYRLRNYAGHPSLHLSAHGTRLDSEKSADTGVVPEKNRWYRFIVIAETESLYTRIAAKVWPQDLPEPLHWQAEATDTSSTRIAAAPSASGAPMTVNMISMIWSCSRAK